MLRAFVLALVAAAILVQGPVARAQSCPNGGVDADADGVCDSGYDRKCCGGVKTRCNDNCAGFANPNQEDFDGDCLGNGVLAGPAPLNGAPSAQYVIARCDKCPFTHSRTNSDRDGDGIGDVCDCAPDDARVPLLAPCPERRSHFLIVAFSVAGGVLLLALLLLCVCGGRTGPWTSGGRQALVQGEYAPVLAPSARAYISH